MGEQSQSHTFSTVHTCRDEHYHDGSHRQVELQYKFICHTYTCVQVERKCPCSSIHHTPQVILVALLGYGCAAAFLHVYDLAIGTILLCFCEDFKVHEYTSDWTCKQVPSCVRSCPHRIIIILHNAAEMQTTICAHAFVSPWQVHRVDDPTATDLHMEVRSMYL